MDGKSLLIEGLSVLVAVLHARHITEALQCVGLAQPVSDLAIQKESLLVVLFSARLVALERPAYAGQFMQARQRCRVVTLADRMADNFSSFPLLPERERPAEVLRDSICS